MPVRPLSMMFLRTDRWISSKHVYTSDLLLEGGQIECVRPFFNTPSCSEVSLTEEMLVTVSSALKGSVLNRVRPLSFFACVSITFEVVFLMLECRAFCRR